MRQIVYIMVLALFFSSCEKEEIVNDIPSIELIETSPTQVVELMEPEDIFPTFERAYNSDKSFLIVEHSEFYNSK